MTNQINIRSGFATALGIVLSIFVYKYFVHGSVEAMQFLPLVGLIAVATVVLFVVSKRKTTT